MVYQDTDPSEFVDRYSVGDEVSQPAKLDAVVSCPKSVEDRGTDRIVLPLVDAGRTLAWRRSLADDLGHPVWNTLSRNPTRLMGASSYSR